MIIFCKCKQLSFLTINRAQLNRISLELTRTIYVQYCVQYLCTIFVYMYNICAQLNRISLELARTIYVQYFWQEIHAIYNSLHAFHMFAAHCVQGWPKPYTHTFSMRCIYGVFSKESTMHTVIYGVHVLFWPTLTVPCCRARHKYLQTVLRSQENTRLTC